MSTLKTQPTSTAVNFATSGIGGCIAWTVVHPFNTLSVRMNLASTSNPSAGKSFLKFSVDEVKQKGIASLYSGLGAGYLRQIFYATSRFGLFEVFRDEMAKYRETDIWSRLFVGVVSGAIAALISCPAEVSLVRMSNDSALPLNQRRNYKNVVDAFQRILKEEGFGTFFSGSGPFVNRAALVGAIQVGTYDQFRQTFRQLGITGSFSNVFYASMSSGIVYSIVTMPLETAKNCMAFQKADPVTGSKPYTSTVQTIKAVVAKEGVFRLYNGFAPYYLRCGGHSVVMFMSLEWMRGLLAR